MNSPVITATTQAAGLSAASNLCAQILQAYQAHRPFSLDPIQLARYVLFTLLTAPLNYHWQQLLERTFPGYARFPPATHAVAVKLKVRDLEKSGSGQDGRDNEPGNTKPRLNIGNTLTKWFVDCITLGTVFNTVSFLALMGAMKGEKLGVIGHSIKEQTIPLIFAGYKLWPIASIVSFSFIPVEKRIVFLSFVGFLWGIYLSLVAAKI